MNWREPPAAVVALSMIALLWAPRAVGDARLPIFDTHIHYSRDAWAPYAPRTVIEILDAANVPRALVSSTPDDGTLKLYREDADRFVPHLAPLARRRGPEQLVPRPEHPDLHCPAV